MVHRSTISTVADALSKGGQTIFTMNLAHMRMLAADQEFLKSYLSASIVTLDSMVVNKIGFRGSFPVATGSDLVHHLITTRRLTGKTVLIIGNISQAQASSFFPGSRVEVITPTFGFIENRNEVDAIVAAASDLAPDVIFIAVGAPQSEKLAATMRVGGLLDRSSILCCGAAFEFELGTQRRSPPTFRAMGFEWLWRLATDPARLLPRYLSDFGFLLSHLSKYAYLRHKRTIDLSNSRIRFEAEPASK